MTDMFFSGAEGLGRTLIVGTLAYAALVVVLRISGKRTLSKLNAFDLVVTVALGSTLSTVLLNKQVALAEGVLAFALLCGLQFSVTWSSVRWSWVRSAVKSEPTLLWVRGEPLDRAMRQQRVTLDEVRAAVRAEGIHEMAGVDAIVLETDGTLSVIPSVASIAPGELPGLQLPSEQSLR
jgi:uncharacterized membrane protein YcaP (DUF421 family)